MVVENGVKNIQAAAYNGARTVFTSCVSKILKEKLKKKLISWTYLLFGCSNNQP